MEGKNRKLNRLRGWDYSQPGYYFVTILTEKAIENFGCVVNDDIQLSPYGKIAWDFWKKIPKYYNNVSLDYFIIMPNHIHGIIVIDSADIVDPVGTEQCSVLTMDDDIVVPVGTEHCSVLLPEDDDFIVQVDNYEMIGEIDYSCSKCGLLSKIVKAFKGVVIKKIHRDYNDFQFGWHRSFYDNIIRNEQALNKIRAYIQNNPVKWKLNHK